MPQSRNAYKSIGLVLSEKRKVILEDIKKCLPTVVISMPEGIYIFSDKLAKVYSTVVMAGAGKAFTPVSDWFRTQIKDFQLLWSRRDPKAEAEIEILEHLFYQNSDINDNVVSADVFLVEIGAEMGEDYIARVSFLGEITKHSGKPIVLFSYRNVEDELYKNGGHMNGADEKNGDSAENLGDGNSEGVAEEVGNRVGQDDGYWDRVFQEFDELGIDLSEAINDQREILPAKFLEKLKNNYPGKKCFLRRDMARKERYHWIFELLD